MDSLVQLLKSSSLFSDLPDAFIESELLPLGQLQSIPKGVPLVMAQERLDVFGLVVDGKINIQYIEDTGNFRITDILEKGDIFGLDLIYTNTRISPYHAVAGRMSKVLFFPAAMILSSEMLPEDVHLTLLKRLLTIISNENMRKEYRIAILSQRGLRDRIMTFLTMQAAKRQTNTFTVPFSRNELAGYLCVNRTSLSHELSLMEQEGIILFDKNKFTLLHWDPAKHKEGSIVHAV